MSAPLQRPESTAAIERRIQLALERASDLMHAAKREVRRAMKLSKQIGGGR